MTDAAWCERGGSKPQGLVDSHIDSALCPRCGRRVRLLSSGKLRRHRVESSVTFSEGVPTTGTSS